MAVKRYYSDRLLAREKMPELVPPLIVGLHGVSPIDLRTMPPSAFDPHAGVIHWNRFKGTGEDAIDYEVPIHDGLVPELVHHVESLPNDQPVLFPIFYSTVTGEPVHDPKDRMIRMLRKIYVNFLASIHKPSVLLLRI